MMNRESHRSDFGGRLREAREQRGISLRQIANATKISVAVLAALERNDVSRLPGGIFGRAFVRSYAVEVGLDPERIIQEFITQFPYDSIVAGNAAVQQVEFHPVIQRQRHAPVILLTLVIGLAAGFAIYFDGWRTLASYAAPLLTARRIRTMSPVPPPAAPAPAPAAAVERSAVEGGPDSNSGVARAASETALPSSTADSSAAADDRLTVRLSVSRPCWISAMVDGRKAIERLVQAGEDQTIDVRREIVLTAADAGAVALTLNGAIAKPLGTAGEVVTARLSLANFRDFLSSR